MRKQITLVGVACVGAVLFNVGCQTDNSSVQDFFPQDQNRASQQFVTAQAASGARADGTLNALHFDGQRLNSLGEAKLDLMLKDDDTAEPVVVYLDLSKDDADLKVRRDAVSNYLVDRGMTTDQLEFKMGANPNGNSLAANHLARMEKLESGGGAEGGAASSEAAAGTTSGAMK
jgi:hypothetical protein